MRVLVVTGASGGHIFPALGFLDTLKDKQKDIDILLLLPRDITCPRPEYRCTEDVIQRDSIFDIGALDYKVNYISISWIKLSFDFRNIIAILKFIRGSLESIFIMLRFRPAIVVAFGTLVCIPLVLFARLLNIKTLIHEQNVICGRANRFLAKFTDKIAVSFLQTQDYFNHSPEKIVLTGNPIRRALKKYDKDKALEFFGFSGNRFTILLMGGSSGSHNINIGFLKAISTICNAHKLQVIHLSGSKDYDLLRHGYRDLNINVKLFTFLKDIQYAYSACDLVLSRGGATTIAEIIFYGLPAIIVPYPYAYRHQLSNAKVLETIGSAIIIKDNQLDTGMLKQTIYELINNPDRLRIMRSHYDNIFKPNSSNLLADEVLSLVRT